MSAAAVRHLNRVDKTLAGHIRRVGPCRLVPDQRRSPFQALVQAVAHQQLNGAAANTILRRLVALFPRRRFPLPQNLLDSSDQQLRSAGLSRAKVASIKDIAAKTLDGTVPARRVAAQMNDAELMERLTTIRGVGPWTVEMLMIFTLGRPDILPLTDFGLRRGFSLVYKCDLPGAEELLERGEKWRPYRSTASWYLWRAVELKS